MLTQLNIQGLAIIDSLAINFSTGFNVITGETGAGKSILIKALGLLLGTKASADTVRRGRDAASVSGLFEAPVGHRCSEVLERYGIPVEVHAGDTPAVSAFDVLVRRTVNSKGRSLAWINDVPVTVGVLRELAMSLIDVFGQHDNLRLLDGAQHLSYVDQFLKDKTLLPRYAAAYNSCQARLKDLGEMIEGFRAKRRDADFLAFRCEELDQFAPSKADYEQVLGLSQRATHQLTLVQGLEEARACLDQGAGGEPVVQPLWEAGRLLGRLTALSPHLQPLVDQLAAVANQVDDLSYQVGKALAGMDLDEQDLEKAQTRLAGYQELFRKLAVQDIDGLLLERDRLNAERGFLATAATEVARQLVELDRLSRDLSSLGAVLSKARAKAKLQVKQLIETELHELAMPGASIDIELSPFQRSVPVLEVGLFGDVISTSWAAVAEQLALLGEHGAEKAQFLLAANPGEALLPLQRIASGGEISRVMLALKRALAAGADTCILVFDEIDTGISGRVADIVGRKMQELADNFQVICISHLAQVAAYADTHFLVHKFDRDQRTESTITQLSAKDSAAEIARLLSGDEVTTSSLANAKALVQKARGKKSGSRQAAGTSVTTN